LLLTFVILCFALPASALDFGLIMQQSPEFTNTGANSSLIQYTGSYAPWFSTALGDNAGLYLSAKLSTVYKSGAWRPASPPLLPELGRFEITWRPRPNVYLEAGRAPFQDVLGFIASGLFDGVSGSVVLGKTRISGGAFYTGFLYKETAKVLMPPDLITYSEPFSYADFTGSYFASRRVILSAAGEFTDLTPRSTLGVNALAQFDVNSPDALYRIHTQYLTTRYTFSPVETLSLAGAAALGLGEARNFFTFFAVTAGVDWEVPGPQIDMLQGEYRWTSGAVNQGIRAFMPITAVPQGQVFSPQLTGLMTLKGKYTIRTGSTFSLSAEGTYFIRTDGVTIHGSDFPASASYLLGAEFYSSLLWAPMSDLMLNLGFGAFFPQLGNVFDEDAPIRWRVAVGLVFAL
jgi:hypothetical protein